MLERLKISPLGAVFTFIICGIFLIGGFLSLQNPSGSLFSRVEIRADFPLQVWRKSVKNNTHEFTSEPTEKNSFYTESSVSNLYIGLPNGNSAGNVDIRFVGLKDYKLKSSEILESWTKVVLPIDEIKAARVEEDMDKYLSGYSFYIAPKEISQKSIVSLLKPAINWGIIFGPIEFLKLTFLSLLLSIMVLFLRSILLSRDQERVHLLTLYSLPAIGFAFSLWLIFKYGVDLFWMDAIAFPYFLKTVDAGKLTWEVFWDQHNEHRIVLVRFLFYILSRFESFNMLTLSVMNQALVFVGVLFFIYKTKGLEKGEQIAFSLIMTLAFFSPAHIENTILPFHGQWHGTVVGMLLVAAIVGNEKIFMKSPVFWIGFLAAYASMPPWVCIPIAILLGLSFRFFSKELEQVSKREWIHFFCFGAITLLFFAYYMHGWTRVSVSPIDGIYKDPLKFLSFFFKLAGNQVQNEKLALVSGILITSLSGLILYLRNKGKAHIPETIVCLLNLSLTWCFITAIGRSTNGSAILPRYVFISTGLWAATLTALWINRKLFHKALVPVFLTASVGLFSLQSLKGFSDGARFFRIIDRDAKLVKKAMKSNDSIHLQYSNLIPIYDLKGKKEDRDHIFELFKYMQDKRYWTILK